MQSLPSDIWSDPGLDGKYRFERVVASGSMAVVVVARHLELDEQVAIKFLSPEALRSRAAVSRFRSEARAAAKIKNQHVVRILDVSTTVSGLPYFVMELLDGMDLERLLALYPERRAPIADAIDFVLQASEAIIEGHTVGIIHRDLKPANLFCVDRGDGYPMIKVLDFGISKFTAKSGDVERTDQHEILGSPRYMSPEQITSAWAVDHRTDIWSLGVILYEAIAGRAPFRDELIPDLWNKIRKDRPEPLNALRPECPAALSAVVLKCLEKEPSRRFSDLSELAGELAPFAPERSRASIVRIRWTIDSSNDVSTRPSCYSDSHVRPTTNPSQRLQRSWLFAGSICVTLGLAVVITTTNRNVTMTQPTESAAEPKPPPPRAAAPEVGTATTRAVVPQSHEPSLTPGVTPSTATPSVPSELSPKRVAPATPRPMKPTAVTATTPKSGTVTTASAATRLPAPTNTAPPPWLVPPIDDREKDLP